MATFLLGHGDAQDAEDARDIFRLHVAVLLFVEAVEHLSVFLDQLWVDFWLQLDWRLLFDFGVCSLHYITDIDHRGLNLIFGIAWPDGSVG